MIAHPRSTLEYLREHGGRTWWGPALLSVLLTILPLAAAAPSISREAVLVVQEQRREQRGVEMSAEEQAQMESVIASPLRIIVFPAAGGVVMLAVGWLAWAGALHLAGTALGGRSTFGQMFRMVVWTWLPYALRGLLQTVYILASGQLIANPGLSGFVLGNDPGGEIVSASPSLGQTVLQALLGRVDLFLFWNLALLMTGVLVVTRLPRRKARLVTLGAWLLLMAVSLLPALVGGLFAQQVNVS
jgi:hypothetical protein